MSDDTAPVSIHVLPTDAPIDEVTVYADRAQVVRRVPLSAVEPGATARVVLTDISSRADVDSFHVTCCPSDFTILEVAYHASWETEEEREQRLSSSLPANPSNVNSSSSASARKEDEKSSAAKEADTLREEIKAVKRSLRDLAASASRRTNKAAWIDSFGKSLVAPVHSSGNNGAAVIERTSVAAAAEFLEFSEKHREEIDRANADAVEEREKLEERKVSLERRLAAVSGRIGSKSETREVVILIERSEAGADAGAKNKDKGKGKKKKEEAKEETTTEDDGPELLLAYVTLGASFSAAYDLRVTRGETVDEDAMAMTYFGVIKNSTEEDWCAAQLTLSTARPSVGGGPPKLAPAKVSFKPTAPVQQALYGGIGLSSSGMMKKRGGRPEMMAQSMAAPMRRQSLCLDDNLNEELESESDDDDLDEMIGGGGGGGNAPGAPRISAAKTAGTGTGSTVFRLPKRVTIEADGKPHKQPIDSLSLGVSFTTCISPKVSPHCFVKASARNTSSLPLLPGPMSVYVNGAFVTNSEIEAVGPSETFACYLGVDDNVRISYAAPKVTRVAAGGGLMSKKTTILETVTQMATIKNAKPHEIRVVMYEQVPQSSTESIKVKLIEPQLSGKDATHSTKINATGNLEWRFSIDAQSEKETKLEYTIEYPKDEKIHVHE